MTSHGGTGDGTRPLWQTSVDPVALCEIRPLQISHRATKSTEIGHRGFYRPHADLSAPTVRTGIAPIRSGCRGFRT